MMSAESAISKARWDRFRSIAVRTVLIVAAVGFIFYGTAGPIIIGAIFLIWIFAGIRNAQGARTAMHWPILIANGRYDEAEREIEEALASFSTLRTVKLLGLHYLAMLRHAQRRFGDSAKLSRAVLGQRRGAIAGVSRQSQLVLADSLLELGDLSGASAAINGLFNQRLSLAEAINLLRIDLDYLYQVGAWSQMIREVDKKVEMAELMPSASAARTLALLAVAAKRTGEVKWEAFLRRRVELIADVQELTTWRPGLAELWNPPGVG